MVTDGKLPPSQAIGDEPTVAPHRLYEKRFAPTKMGIIAASFVLFLKQNAKGRLAAIVAGITLLTGSVTIWLAVSIPEIRNITLINHWTFTAVLPLIAIGVYILYLSALAGPEYGIKVAEEPEVEQRKTAEEKVEKSPTPQALLELDFKRLTEYYVINQSQARWSFFWAVVAFVGGFGTILRGIWRFYVNAETRDVDMAGLTTIAGVVTNAVSVMFLYLYNQIHGRSLYYYNQLARVHLIGVAIHLAETHAEEAEKGKARNKIITDLLNAGQTLANTSATKGRKRGKSSDDQGSG